MLISELDPPRIDTLRNFLANLVRIPSRNPARLSYLVCSTRKSKYWLDVHVQPSPPILYLRPNRGSNEEIKLLFRRWIGLQII